MCKLGILITIFFYNYPQSSNLFIHFSAERKLFNMYTYKVKVMEFHS